MVFSWRWEMEWQPWCDPISGALMGAIRTCTGVNLAREVDWFGLLTVLRDTEVKGRLCGARLTLTPPHAAHILHLILQWELKHWKEAFDTPTFMFPMTNSLHQALLSLFLIVMALVLDQLQFLDFCPWVVLTKNWKWRVCWGWKKKCFQRTWLQNVNEVK